MKAFEASSFTFAGSTIGTMVSSALALAPQEVISAGLCGFNPALTALCVYTFLAPQNNSTSSLSLFSYACTGALASTFLNFAALPFSQSLLSTPLFSLPFCFISLLAIWLAPRLKFLKLKSRF